MTDKLSKVKIRVKMSANTIVAFSNTKPAYEFFKILSGRLILIKC